MDTAGNFIWARYISDSYNGACGSITVDNSGNIYTVGSFKGVDFNPDPLLVYNLTVPGSGSNGYISKLDSAGNFIWAKQLVSPTPSALSGCLDIKLDVAQNPLICGSFNDSTDFDPGLGVTKIGSVGTGGHVDAYILKLNSSGSFLWVRTIGGNLNDYAESLSCDAQDNIYISGRFNNQVDFDPGPAIFNLTPAGSASNAFILKLDNNGIFKWAKNVEGNNNLDGYSIALDASANIFVCGLLQGSADFDPGPAVFNLTTAGNDDAFVLKLDSLGNFLGAKRIGGTGTEKCYSITVDAGGNCYTAGSYEVTANFDSPASSLLTSAGYSDIFIAKYGVFGIGISENISGLNATLYPNPTKGAFEINLGQHYSFLEIIIHDMLGKEISRTKYIDASRLKAIIPGESWNVFCENYLP
ncbi:MAG: SBBP repeat-containing protein [Bacteroidetes bacterium]|nr:SBBP repeat-containing protein [Bacteroidota bacterium]